MTRRFTSDLSSVSEPSSGHRVSIDSLVQASLVELFAAYGVAFAPLPSATSNLPVPEAPVAAAFRHAGGEAGRLVLSVPEALLEHMRRNEPIAVRMDWARELANQLLGRIKNRLLPFGVRLEIGLLTSLDPKLLQRQLQDTSRVRVYVGRTVRGLVLVTLQGLPKDAALSYVGAAGVPEGAMLWL